MLNFDPVTLPASSEQLRPVIRAFIADNLPEGRRNSDFTSGYDAAFSAKLGAAGWIGMTIPRRYGGSERGYFDRYIVTEELLTGRRYACRRALDHRPTNCTTTDDARH
jgi:alkylation response protein AidB-like acyl-CoA dehydrogenase